MSRGLKGVAAVGGLLLLVAGLLVGLLTVSASDRGSDVGCGSAFRSNLAYAAGYGGDTAVTACRNVLSTRRAAAWSLCGVGTLLLVAAALTPVRRQVPQPA